MEHDTAGDPMTGLKWIRRTTDKIPRELTRTGIRVSPNTVGRILKELGYCLRVNSKKISSGSSPDRNAQFENIADLCEQFSARGMPVISVRRHQENGERRQLQEQRRGLIPPGSNQALFAF